MATALPDGKIMEDEEVLLIIKTAGRMVQDVKKIIDRSHPYEVPEFWVIEALEGSDEYLKWIDNSTWNCDDLS